MPTTRSIKGTDNNDIGAASSSLEEAQVQFKTGSWVTVRILPTSSELHFLGSGNYHVLGIREVDKIVILTVYVIVTFSEFLHKSHLLWLFPGRSKSHSCGD